MSLPSLAERCSGVSSFLVMQILEKAQKMQAQGADIIHLEIGEPDFDTPLCIVEAGQKALQDGQTHYTASKGIPSLRKAVAAHYLKQYNVHIDPEQVLIFPGTSSALFTLFGAILNAGDEVIVSNPSYACYGNFIRYAGGKVHDVLTHEEEGFHFRPEDVAKAMNAKTKALVINSPTNPTGIVMEESRMQALVKVCNDFAIKHQGITPLIISDEIYHGLSYEGKDHSILEYTQNAIVLNGFSKAYAMTGWRLGYAIVPMPYVRSLTALMENFFLCTNTMAQLSGVCALEKAEKDVENMRATYNERRLYVLSALRELGFHIPVEPKGAFYVLINAKNLAKKFDGSSVKLAFDILEKAHVGITPGSEFGSQTEGFLRISYANSMENLQKAMKRLADYINQQ